MAWPLLGLNRIKLFEAEEAVFLKGLRKPTISLCWNTSQLCRKPRRSSALLSVPEVFVCAFKACSLCELQTCLNNLGGLQHYSNMCAGVCVHGYGVFIPELALYYYFWCFLQNGTPEGLTANGNDHLGWLPSPFSGSASKASFNFLLCVLLWVAVSQAAVPLGPRGECTIRVAIGIHLGTAVARKQHHPELFGTSCAVERCERHAHRLSW